ncbi:helicase associated domain-containing protein [Streptomyces sp. RTd22]|uniref:helicase associated domain-containing protein n=1 Tax=Streptomyces sp. RTd22 TaxID=1841249 RepID=UPI0007C42E51|nr:helicase associated domain-containing protein [Streptomyces sp. RTd22]
MALRTSTSSGQATSVVALDPQHEDTDEDEDEQAADEAVDSASTAEDHGEDHLEESAGSAEAGSGPQEEEESGAEAAGVPLLRFSLPRNPDVIAAFLRTRVLRPDSEVWLSGLNALRRWVQTHGDAQVPLDAEVPIGATEGDGGDSDGGTYALGAWVSEQRRQFRLGTLKPWRAELLDELGMVWSVADARFWKNLAAARVYHAVHGTLAAPKDAVVDGVAVGQWLANLRKAGGLGRDEERAAERRRALEAIDPDWNPDWPIDWQRRYAALASLIADQATLAELLPGVTFGDQDIGAWLEAQREGWEQLSDGQRERLSGLGVTPLPKPEVPPAKARKGASGAFERGVAALERYKTRTGSVKVPRGHTEKILVDGQEHAVKLGVWRSNMRSRQASLPLEQRRQLAVLGLFDWLTRG